MKFVKTIMAAALLTTAISGAMATTDHVDLSAATPMATYKVKLANLRNVAAMPEGTEAEKLEKAITAEAHKRITALGIVDLTDAKNDWEIPGVYNVIDPAGDGSTIQGRVRAVAFNALKKSDVLLALGMKKTLASFPADARAALDADYLRAAAAVSGKGALKRTNSMTALVDEFEAADTEDKQIALLEAGKAAQLSAAMQKHVGLRLKELADAEAKLAAASAAFDTQKAKLVALGLKVADLQDKADEYDRLVGGGHTGGS